MPSITQLLAGHSHWLIVSAFRGFLCSFLDIVSNAIILARLARVSAPRLVLLVPMEQYQHLVAVTIILPTINWSTGRVECQL